MRKPAVIAVLLFACLAAGCQNLEPSRRAGGLSGGAEPVEVEMAVDQAVQESAAAPDGAPGAPPASAAPPVPADSRKLIRTVELELRVRATEPAAREAQALAPKLGGYVSQVSAHRMDGLMHYRLTLRIPTARLDEALAALRKLAVRVESESQQVEDVTDRYIDLDARVRTLEGTERELQALLAESRQRRAGVEDIMAVYRQLTEIRSQIEVLQGQREALSRQVALSTVQLQLTPVEAARPLTEDEWRPGDTARGSVRVLFTVLRGIGNALIFVVIVLVPTVLVLWLLALPLRGLWRRSRKRRPAPVPPPVTPPVGPSGPGV